MVDRLIHQHLCLFAGAGKAEERKEGFLARIAVLAEFLARQFLVALDVENIVGDLEGEADVAGVAA